MTTENGQIIRILHVLGSLNMGGAESRIMDLYRHMDRDRVQFDFLVHGNGAGEREPQFYDEEILSMGGHIYPVARFTGKNLGAYKAAMKAFFTAHHEFAAVEGHMTSTASIYLPIAKACGVPVTIAHARSAGVDAGIKGLATRVLRLSLPRSCDYMLSCSGLASISVYGRAAYEAGKVIYAPNALDTAAYAYNEASRAAIRTELGIPESAFVIGHVGRFDKVKNQTLLAQAAALLHLADPDVDFRFLFVGEGDLQETVQAIFREEGIADLAVMPGVCDRSRTAMMYSAMDLFCLPSLYEGLPGTVLEAQASGLPCLISDVITDEVMVTGSVQKLPNTDPKIWAATLDKALAEVPAQGGDYRAQRSASALMALADAGFDINRSSQVMQTWYEVLAADPNTRHELRFS